MAKTIAVFGVGPGWSYQVARKFAQQGYTNVALVARTKPKLEAQAERLRKDVPNAKVGTFLADVSDNSQLNKAIDSIFSEFKTVDAVFNSACPTDFEFVPAAKVKEDLIHPLMKLMFYSNFVLVERFLPPMLERKEGCILFALGATAVHPKPGMSGGGPVGAALRNWIFSLHGETASQGVHVGGVVSSVLILGSENGDRLDKMIPAKEISGIGRMTAEEVAEITWDSFQKKQWEREI